MDYIKSAPWLMFKMIMELMNPAREAQEQLDDIHSGYILIHHASEISLIDRIIEIFEKDNILQISNDPRNKNCLTMLISQKSESDAAAKIIQLQQYFSHTCGEIFVLPDEKSIILNIKNIPYNDMSLAYLYLVLRNLFHRDICQFLKDDSRINVAKILEEYFGTKSVCDIFLADKDKRIGNFPQPQGFDLGLLSIEVDL